MVAIDCVPDWSSLLTDLLVEIATKLSVIEDFMAFRGVCTSWRVAATKDKFVSVSKVPLLMLAEKDSDGDVRELYSLCKRKIFMRMLVPEAKGKMCIGAGFGWILTVAISGGEINLVKPMSSSEKIKLPNMMNFPKYEQWRTCKDHVFVRQAMLSSDPSETSDFVLMVVFYKHLVGFWKNKDHHWTKIDHMIKKNLGRSLGICYYKHKMYVYESAGNIWMFDPYLNQTPEILLRLHANLRVGMERAYLVESSKGDLLLIYRSSAHSAINRGLDCCYFGIVQIDTVNGDYTEIDTLDRDAIFIGQNSGAVSADDFPGIVKANCIYFTDDD